MCGRYSFTIGTIKDVETIFGYEISGIGNVNQGDICPSMDAIVLAKEKTNIAPFVMKWGVPLQDSSKLLINARSETAMNKRMFSDSIMNRRCIIPADHFYEWDREKNKSEFYMPDKSTIYMLGFYNNYTAANIRNTFNSFVILTTAANESVIGTHERMPLIINKERVCDWIFDNNSVQYFLNMHSPLLAKYQEYEQLRFNL